MKHRLDPRDVKAAERLEVVGELASLINTTFDLSEIFRAAIQKIRRVLEFRRASVVLISDDRSHYYLHTLYDDDRGGFISQDGTFSVERGLTGEAIRTGQAIRADEVPGTEGIQSEGERSVSALIVPLSVDGDVIGTLNFGARESARYGDEDLELAVLLARQIETSLHYSKLLSTIREQGEALAREHAQVESQRRRLVALIEASDVAILMAAADRVVHANRAMAELTGLPPEVVLGADLERINRALARSLKDAEALEAQVTALEGTRPLRDRVEFVFPRHLICERTVAPVRGADDDVEVIGHIVLYRDVTREAEAEAAKNEFVSIVSHELRTPLTSIKTSLKLLAKGAVGAVGEQMQGFLDIALRNLDRLIRLVDDLLDLSRIESGHVVTALAPTSARAATDRAVEAVRGYAQEREVAIEAESPPDSLHVVADADRLEQVIVNLLSNAVKFSPTGGRVGLRWWARDQDGVLEITDEGAGIPSDQLETIFDKFLQLEKSATRRHGGAGLGLAISRSIVEQFGGEIWAESERDRGSRFCVRLRIAAPSEPTPEMSSELPAARRVLIVERDADLLRLSSAQFEEAGWDVVTISSGAEALTEAAVRPPHVIVAGVELQDMHGLEFLQQLRRRPRVVDIPALVVGSGVDEAEAVAYGADGWLVGDGEAVVSEATRIAAAPRRRVVLVVEDDPAVRGGLTRILRKGGYACLDAASGRAGLDIARQRRPDLVITDWHLPELDGLSLLREMRSGDELSGVPAILLTGHAEPRALEEARALGARVVTKPTGGEAILREVSRSIEPVAESPGR